MTIAQKISARFDDDGQCFDATDGQNPIHIDAACRVHARPIYEDRDREDASVRYEFADGSVITIDGGWAWDFGRIGCWCWRRLALQIWITSKVVVNILT